MSQLFTQDKGLYGTSNHGGRGGGHGTTTDGFNVSRPIVLMLAAAVFALGMFLHFMATPLRYGPENNFSAASTGHVQAINPSVLNLQNREEARSLCRSH